MKLSTTIPTALIDQAKNLDAATAQQVLTALKKSDGSATAKCRDLGALLRGSEHVSADARDMLQSFLDSHGKAGSGHSAIVVRGSTKRAKACERQPLPDGQVWGADIDSCYARDGQAYRETSLPLQVLRDVGAPAATLALLERADQLGEGGDGCVSTAELVTLEQTCALLPDEKAALKDVWRYMAASGKSTRAKTPDVPELAIDDLSVRPEAKPLEQRCVDITALPKPLQNAATRAAMIARGCPTAPTTVTLADLRFAIENKHEQSTPADRERFAELCGPVQAEAVAQTAGDYAAKLQIPDLGATDQKLVSCSAFSVTLKTETTLSGTEQTRGSWTARGSSHGRNAPCVPAPRSFPPPHQVQLGLDQKHQLAFDVPPGFKVVMQREGQKNAQVVNGGCVDLPAGRYAALLMRNGRLVHEAAVVVPANKRQDISKFFGFELETCSGEQVGLRTAPGKSYQNLLSAVVGSEHQLGIKDHPVALESGRYEGKLNNKMSFGLEVLPGNNLSIYVDGKCARLNFTAHRQSYIGNLGGQVFRFDPKTSQLSLTTEGTQRHHGSTAWSYSIRERKGQPVRIEDKMRIA